MAVIRDIYRQFVEDGASERQLADRLNATGIAAENGRRWTLGIVHQILINEKYVGNNVWNRVSFKLKLLGNARFVGWLAQNQPDYLAEFQTIAEIESIAATRPAAE